MLEKGKEIKSSNLVSIKELLFFIRYSKADRMTLNYKLKQVQVNMLSADTFKLDGFTLL